MLHLLYGTSKFIPQNHSSSFQYVVPLNFRGSLSFKTCYGINLFQVVIITAMLLATFYVDVYIFCHSGLCFVFN
jgi:hypothetical protein